MILVVRTLKTILLSLFIISCSNLQQEQTLGALEVSEIQSGLNSKKAELRDCFNLNNFSGPEVIDLSFIINGEGNVQDLGVKSQGKQLNKKSENCFISTLKNLKYSKPHGGGIVKVRQPMSFQSNL